MAFKMALEYTKKMGDQALRAAARELYRGAATDVIRFLASFSPEVLKEALRAAEQDRTQIL